MNDLKFAFRQLLKNPGFTAVTVSALALGIGANSAIFSIVNAVLLRPLPYPMPGQLVQVKKSVPPNGAFLLGGGEYIGGPEFLEWKEQNKSLSHLAAYSGDDFNLTGGDFPERVICGRVSADFFTMLGVQPVHGRSFLPEEDHVGGPRVALVTHGLWQRRFGSDPSLIGKTVTLNKESFAVIGILPAAFQFPEPFEIWMPLALDVNRERGGEMISLLRVIGRLKPGVTMERARSELDTITQRMEQENGRRPARPPGGQAQLRTSPPPGSENKLPLPEGGEMISRPFSGPPAPRSEAEPTISQPLPGQKEIDLAVTDSTDTFKPFDQENSAAVPFEKVLPPSPPSASGLRGEMTIRPFTGAPGTNQQGDAVMKTDGDRGQAVPMLGGGGRVNLIGLHEQIVGNVRIALFVLLGAVGFVLLIACANVANLLLARAAERQKEVAIRAALGASRFRVIRQLLTESVLLSLMGGGLGLLLAFWGIDLLRGFSLAILPRFGVIRIDGWVLGFSLLVSVLTGLIFGLAPALQASRLDLNESLKESGRNPNDGPPRHRLRNLLVVSEVALALVLLISAGLLIKSFARLRSVTPGFHPDHVLTMAVNLTESKYPQKQQQIEFFRELLQRIQSLPGVRSAGATDHLPLTDYSMMMTIRVEGYPAPVFGKDPPVSIASVSADYFRAMGIPLRTGRAFNERDLEGAPAVAIVNEAFVRRYFQNEDPLGKRFFGAGPGADSVTIVGVVGDVRQSGLDSEVGAEAYRPFLQTPRAFMTLAIRAAGNPMNLAGSVRSLVTAADKEQPIHNLMTMEQRLANSMAPRRLNMLLLGAFAALALALAAVGIYGVMSYAVTQRTHEIGVRMALGAGEGDVLKLVVRQGMVLTLVGVAIGLTASVGLTQYLASLLFGVNAMDPITYLGVSLVLATVAFFACWLPARRAAKVDPMVALRCE